MIAKFLSVSPKRAQVHQFANAVSLPHLGGRSSLALIAEALVEDDSGPRYTVQQGPILCQGVFGMFIRGELTSELTYHAVQMRCPAVDGSHKTSYRSEI